MGDTVETQNEIRFRPDILKNENGELFFPNFFATNKFQRDMARVFQKCPCLSVLMCIRMARATEDVKGLVFDPFSEPMPLDFDLCGIIEKLPSRIKE